MDVLGLDLAADAKNTGAVILTEGPRSRWKASVLGHPADDDALVAVARTVDLIGVDSPLGWRTAFVEAVVAHEALLPWPSSAGRSRLTHRETDRTVRQAALGRPLSVSADKLGSVAMRRALLQHRWTKEVWGRAAPRDGSGPLVETYPAAAFVAWGISSSGYKDRREPAQSQQVRARMFDEISVAAGSWLDIEPLARGCVESDHILDALASALVALTSVQGFTLRPSQQQLRSALIEGWIHFPLGPLDALPR